MVSDNIRGLIAATTLLAMASDVSAALVTFTDRAAWQVAAGGSGDQFQNFDSIPQQSYAGCCGGPVTAGFLTLTVVGGGGDSSYMVDVPPSNFNDVPDVNGSTYILALSHPSGDTQLSFAPATALGFDYSGGSYSTVDGLLTTSRGDSVTIVRSDSGTFFLGFLYTNGETFDSLTWGRIGADGTNNFGAGVDNVEVFSAPVPLPAPVWLLGLTVLGGLSFTRRRSA